MKIIYKKVSELKPYSKNMKSHPPDQLVKIRKSIEAFGFNVPLIVTQYDEVIAGHGRLLVAKDMALEEVPCIVKDDLSKEEIKSLRIMDNKSAESDWDWDFLKEELKGLKDSDFDMDLTGFSQDEINSLFNDENAEVEEDSFDTEEALKAPKYKVERGDCYQLGSHRLFCGNATKSEDVGLLMLDEKPSILLMDPPYGMNLDTDWTDVKGKKGTKFDFSSLDGGGKYKKVIGDEIEFDPRPFFDMFKEVKEQFWWGADYYADKLPKGGSFYVWDKRVIEEADNMFGSSFELAWSKTKHKREIIRKKWVGVFGLGNQDTKGRVHPTQKPLEVYSWFLNKFTKEDELVLDLFGGSGSTLISCEQTNRKCRMMEIDVNYCSVIIERWEKLTNKTHKKL